MCGFWKKSSNNHASSAKVVDGNLILSLPDAVNPIVWRMELGSVKASALEVRTTNDNTHLLALKTPKGDVHEIAPFDTRDKAVQALMNVSRALHNAEGQINPASAGVSGTAASSAGSGSSIWKWAVSIIGILAVLYVLALAFVPASPTATSDTAPASEDTQSGVPMSADQYLRGF